MAGGIKTRDLSSQARLNHVKSTPACGKLTQHPHRATRDRCLDRRALFQLRSADHFECDVQVAARGKHAGADLFVGFPDRQGKLGLRNALGGLILSIFERSLVFKVNTQNEFHLRLFQAGELRERVRNISGTVPLDLGSFVFPIYWGA